MADIQFQEPQYGSPQVAGVKRSWLTGLVLKTGLAKDEAGAQRVLLIILVLAVIGTMATLVLGSGSSTKPVDLNIDGTPR